MRFTRFVFLFLLQLGLLTTALSQISAPENAAVGPGLKVKQLSEISSSLYRTTHVLDSPFYTSFSGVLRLTYALESHPFEFVASLDVSAPGSAFTAFSRVLEGDKVQREVVHTNTGQFRFPYTRASTAIVFGLFPEGGTPRQGVVKIRYELIHPGAPKHAFSALSDAPTDGVANTPIPIAPAIEPPRSEGTDLFSVTIAGSALAAASVVLAIVLYFIVSESAASAGVVSQRAAASAKAVITESPRSVTITFS